MSIVGRVSFGVGMGLARVADSKARGEGGGCSGVVVMATRRPDAGSQRPPCRPPRPRPAAQVTRAAKKHKPPRAGRPPATLAPTHRGRCGPSGVVAECGRKGSHLLFRAPLFITRDEFLPLDAITNRYLLGKLAPYSSI